MNRKVACFLFYAISFCPFTSSGQTAVFEVTNKVPDKFVSAEWAKPFGDFDGYLGERMRINREKRLLRLDLASLLYPFTQRPGKQTWIGEHVGKFLHAGTLCWKVSGSQLLRQKLDSVARVLISTQLPDGYLGTYLEKDRWTEWDVWTHKYNLIGLLTYYSATGYSPALHASEKIGDLLINTFQNGDKDIIEASTHVGMASTSVLEGMVNLYRYTGDNQYLDFCYFLTEQWENARGPKILSELLQHGNVYRTANGKAYEMLSNLVGLLELYRVTGEEKFVRACVNAWNDIKSNRHYIVGTTSWGEHFQNDHSLRLDGEVIEDKFTGPGEGCVTVTWEQLNIHLLRLTGESRYADELELIIYNSLPGAQSPLNGSVCYFIPLEGRKRYGEVSHGILPDISCCASSIPRGIALVPWVIAGTRNEANAVIWQYVSGSFPIRLDVGGTMLPAELQIATSLPDDGISTVTVFHNQKTAQLFALELRVPAWSDDFTVIIGTEQYKGKPGQLLSMKRKWKSGDKLNVSMKISVKFETAGNVRTKQSYFRRGPQILATDDMLDTRSQLPDMWTGNQLYMVKATVNGQKKLLRMVPFADAGQTHGHYRVFHDGVTSAELVSPGKVKK